jgi:hypothetical protein
MPRPTIWPVCPECGVAFVLRRAMTFSTAPSRRRTTLRYEWLWSRDCKHKKVTPVAHNAQGLIPAEELAE